MCFEILHWEPTMKQWIWIYMSPILTWFYYWFPSSNIHRLLIHNKSWARFWHDFYYWFPNSNTQTVDYELIRIDTYNYFPWLSDVTMITINYVCMPPDWWPCNNNCYNCHRHNAYTFPCITSPKFCVYNYNLLSTI